MGKETDTGSEDIQCLWLRKFQFISNEVIRKKETENTLKQTKNTQETTHTPKFLKMTEKQKGRE